MKIFHLGDLHLGKSIYGRSMIEDQAFWIERFIELCKEKKPDVVLVAGDVYDRASPAAEAVKLLDRFITGVTDLGIKILIVAGNHDSGEKISFAADLLKREGVVIAGKAKKEMVNVEIEGVRFYLMPYIFPEEVKTILKDEEIRGYDNAARRLINEQHIDESKINILVAHQNVIANGVEVERGGSESMVGGVGEIDYSAFDMFDYVALGHIHSSYPVAREEVRYAGTPLCYHLEETRQPDRGPLLIEISDKEEGPTISREVIRPLHNMRYLKGNADEIYEILKDDTGRSEYVGIVIKDKRIDPEMASYFRDLLNSRDSILMDLTSEYHEYSASGQTANMTDIKEKKKEDLFSDLIRRKSNDTPPSDEEYELMRFVSEMMDNRDISEAITEADVDKIIDEARRIGG